MKLMEINGVKLEVDMRTAKTVESYKVGDPVKVLVKKYSEWKVCNGMIVDFCDFKEMPTIVVAYMTADYSPDLEFVYLNAANAEIQIAPAGDTLASVDKGWIVRKIDDQIKAKQSEIESLEARKRFFLERFAKYFSDFAK
jgi:hypothetical protein